MWWLVAVDGAWHNGRQKGNVMGLVKTRGHAAVPMLLRVSSEEMRFLNKAEKGREYD